MTWLKLAAMLVAAGVVAHAGTNEGASFVDEFDTLSGDRWTVSDGGANGEWQNCAWAEEAVGLSSGSLELNFLPAASGGHPYSCAELQSNQRFGYGTFEARIRTDRAPGLNAAFSTYIGPAQDSVHNEINFEIPTREPTQVSLNALLNGEAAHGTEVALPRGTAGEFNTYAFVWEPHRLRWYVNGELVHEATDMILPLPDTPQKIMLSHWGSETLTDWMGHFARPSAPVKMEVDWVAYTALGAPCQFPGSVACSLN